MGATTYFLRFSKKRVRNLVGGDDRNEYWTCAGMILETKCGRPGERTEEYEEVQDNRKKKKAAENIRNSGAFS